MLALDQDPARVEAAEGAYEALWALFREMRRTVWVSQVVHVEQLQ